MRKKRLMNASFENEDGVILGHRFRLEKLNGLAEQARLEAFLKLSDAWTTPALSERVELSAFARKILRNGVAVVAV